MGVLGILAGIVVMRHPIASALAIPSIMVLLLGIQGFVAGIVSLVMAFRGGGWGAGILGGLSVLFGLILMANYASLGTVLTFIWVVAILAIIGGIAEIVLALRLREGGAPAGAW
jgi:uncharacterized membrane protein HdeD (DUF308 family)